MEDKISDLSDAVISDHTIECEKCNTVDVEGLCDSFDAAEIFYDEGWRIINNKTLCPKCVSKRKK